MDGDDPAESDCFLGNILLVVQLEQAGIRIGIRSRQQRTGAARGGIAAFQINDDSLFGIELDELSNDVAHLLDTAAGGRHAGSTGSASGTCRTSGVNVGLMRDLGFTVMGKDENGAETHEIDWTKTRAVASRANQIYINLKGRYEHGIVEPEDKYELEEEIMTALYGARHPISGKRVIGLALRNKDAVILGYGGERCGDILAWTAEGYNDDHFDAITTTYGLHHTSLMPIFIGAGPGIKQGELTKRVIRQVDFAPTVAIIGGVRMPRECEGAPIYQILENDF